MLLKRIGRAGALAAMLVCLASAAFAQGGSATFSGTVFDQAKRCCPASPSR